MQYRPEDCITNAYVKLSTSWQMNLKNQSRVPQQPKFTKTSRCGAVASALSISYLLLGKFRSLESLGP